MRTGCDDDSDDFDNEDGDGADEEGDGDGDGDEEPRLTDGTLFVSGVLSVRGLSVIDHSPAAIPHSPQSDPQALLPPR